MCSGSRMLQDVTAFRLKLHRHAKKRAERRKQRDELVFIKQMTVKMS